MRTIIAVCFVFAFAADQESISLKESARHNGGKVLLEIHAVVPMMTIEEASQRATVVVQGVVKTVETRLSADEKIVVTEYQINPVRVYKSPVQTSQRPGFPSPLIVDVPGGRLSTEGLELRTVVNDFPETDSSLVVGERVFLFLSPQDGQTGTFRLTGGSFGALRISNSTVLPLTRQAGARRGDQPRPVEDVEREILESVRK
jgi:hypothetical protein